MNASIFGEWLRRQEHVVLKTETSYWVDFGPRVYQAFPFHSLIEPSEDELNKLLTQHRAVGIRYSTPVDAPRGQISYHAVYEQNTYEIESLSKSTRKNIRRGLRNCTIEPIRFEELASEGWQLQVDTLDRQGRAYKLDDIRKAWMKRCLSAVDLPGFEAWGARVDGTLAASVITFVMNDCIYMLYQQCHREYLPHHVNNALAFTVTKTMIDRPEIKSILYGLHSLDAPPSVDEYKFRMGYSAKIVRQRVVFHPWVSPLVNSLTYRAIQKISSWHPHNIPLAKSEGLMRFYRQGLLAPEQQLTPQAFLQQDVQDED